MQDTETASGGRQNIGQPTWYITTAIPYVNAPPHIGFALEMIQADVLARYRRAEGYDVRFQAGTDENSLKNVQAAEAAGIGTETLVRVNAEKFRELGDALNLSIDDFIRTSAEPRHGLGVEKLWRACAANGDVYKKAYTGLYCVGCEQFYKPAELRNGCCPEHGLPPEEISEENYFFRLSRYRDDLRRAITSGELRVEPPSRRNEVLRWIEGELDDFSISRSATRARGWGIPVPGDSSQVIYVWFDALGNYITALEYGSDGDNYARFWRDATAREHVIGKGITRFHAVYWPAMLLSAGLALPSRIFVHGYVTVEGRKIGKSVGNAIDPIPLAEELGADALRYYLLRHVRGTEDGDFARERFVQAYRSDLVGQLGNLVLRTLSMVDRYFGGVIPVAAPGAVLPGTLSRVARRLPATVKDRVENFAFHDALSAIWDLIGLANKYVADTEPWSLAKQATSAPGSERSEQARARLQHCLLELADSLCVIGRCLAPFLPATSDKLLRQIGMDPVNARMDDDARPDGKEIRKNELLFPNPN